MRKQFFIGNPAKSPDQNIKDIKVGKIKPVKVIPDVDFRKTSEPRRHVHAKDSKSIMQRVNARVAQEKDPLLKALKVANASRPAMPWRAVKNPMPFNLEQAKAGVPIRKRIGTRLWFVAFDASLKEPLLVSETRGTAANKKLLQYNADGSDSAGELSSYDVVMNVESKPRWLVLEDNLKFGGKSPKGGIYTIFDSEAQATLYARENSPRLDEPFSVIKQFAAVR